MPHSPKGTYASPFQLRELPRDSSHHFNIDKKKGNFRLRICSDNIKMDCDAHCNVFFIFPSNTTTYFLPLFQRNYTFRAKRTINGQPIQHFKVEIKAKYFARIFTLWNSISSQELLQCKEYTIVKMIKI
jgi:hypothetical protein